MFDVSKFDRCGDLLHTDASSIGLRPGQAIKKFTIWNAHGDSKHADFQTKGQDETPNGQVLAWHYVEIGPTPTLQATIYND